MWYFACSGDKAAKQEVAPIIATEDFFKNPQNAGFSLSPSGDLIAFTKPVNQRMNVFYTRIGSGDTTQLTKILDRDVAAYFWNCDFLKK